MDKLQRYLDNISPMAKDQIIRTLYESEKFSIEFLKRQVEEFNEMFPEAELYGASNHLFARPQQ